MTHVRSLTLATCLTALVLAGGALGRIGANPVTPKVIPRQNIIVDEGAFRITRPGGAGTEVESFRIQHTGPNQLVASANVKAGTRRVTSHLVTDTLGTPISYHLTILDEGMKDSVRAEAGSGRLSTMVSNRRGDEAQRDYPIGRERSVILDDELVHQMYFLRLNSQSGSVRVISPHAARVATFVIAAHGLEPIDIGGQSVTATHFSLVNGGDRRDVWLDAEGRVLRAETSSGLKAVRDELPRQR